MSFRKLLPNSTNGGSSSSLRRYCCKTLNAEKFSVIKSRYLLSLHEKQIQNYCSYSKYKIHSDL